MTDHDGPAATAPTTVAPAVPRDRSDDHTEESAARRRQFVREVTGVALEHVGAYSGDPADPAGQHRELRRRRPGADRHRGPAAGQRRARPGRLLRPDGHHRGHPGRQLQPRDAPADRRGRGSGHRGRRPDAAGTGVPVRRRAEAHEFGAGSSSTSRPSPRRRRRPPASVRSSRSSSMPSARLLTCASTTPRATRPGRTWSAEPRSPRASGSSRTIPLHHGSCCPAAIDTDKKHSQINVLRTRGKRVVAEATLPAHCCGRAWASSRGRCPGRGR